MEINYLEIKDRLINLYKSNAFNFENSNGKKQTPYERFSKYVKIFLGENVEVSKVDSTNLHEFVRKVLKDMHPDSNNLSSEFKDIASFISAAYTDIKKNINEHPTYAINFEYISKQALENENNISKDNKDNVTDDTLDSSKSDDKIKDNPKIENDTNSYGVANVDQFTKASENKDMVADQSVNTFATRVIPVGQPVKDYQNVNTNENNYKKQREIVINYVEVKERLIKASLANQLNVTNTTAKERYTKYCQIILGLDDIRNVDSANFRNVCAQIMNDFSNETINKCEEKIFVAEDNDLQNIQNFLTGAFGELNDKFEILSDNPYQISYVGRSKVNEADEALVYNMRNMKDKKEQQRKDETPKLNNEQEPIPALPEKNKKDVKAYMKAVGKLLPYALAGAGVGLATATILPTVTFSGLGTIRIVYSTAKLANKIVSKGFLHGEPTPVDNIIMNAKDKLKEKYGDKKVYQAIEKVNTFLKNPKVQWFLNGAAIGYKIGEALDLHDKLNDMLHPEKNTIDTQVMPESSANKISNQEPNVNNQAPERAAGTNPTTPENGISYDNPIGPEAQTPSYANLNTGDNIDLSSIDHGFVNSANAMSEADPVHLLTELANRENGTSIKLLKLPDGSSFTGNIGDLLQSGIDPNQVAARIVNQNGEYAWLNLQDILDTYSNGMGMSR